MIADAFRIFTLIVLGFGASLFPAAVVAQGRIPSAYFAVMGCEILMLGYIASIIAHFGDPISWYRTPTAFVAAVFFVVYIFLVRDEGRHS